jgi:hypothetical protein
MPMVPSRMSAAIQSSLASKGNSGSNLSTFCSALGNGSVRSLVGKTFNTIDTGTTPGSGVGTGIGIQGVSASAISKACQAYYLMEFGTMGPLFPDIADAYSQALEAELLSATLTSSHSPVFAGSGVIQPGSLKVSASEWSSSIQTAAPTLLGSDWPRFCEVLGKGSSFAMTAATGQVTISGAGTPPPVPVVGVPNTVLPSGVIT